MFLSKKTICLGALIILSCFSNASYAIKEKANAKGASSLEAASKNNAAFPISHRFDISFTTGSDYLESLHNIQHALGTGLGEGDESDGLFINAPENTYSLVQVRALDEWHQATLVMRNRDWYVVGFISGGIWFSFNDTADFQLEGLDNSTPINALSSHYSDLVRVGGLSRSHLMLSSAGIDHAIIGLHNYGNGQVHARQLARSLLLLTTVISEAARFRTIAHTVTQGMSESSGVMLGDELAALTNDWQRLSDQAHQLAELRLFANAVDLPYLNQEQVRLWGILSLALGGYAASLVAQ